MILGRIQHAEAILVSVWNGTRTLDDDMDARATFKQSCQTNVLILTRRRVSLNRATSKDATPDLIHLHNE
jgi:hypothetical protein